MLTGFKIFVILFVLIIGIRSFYGAIQCFKEIIKIRKFRKKEAFKEMLYYENDYFHRSSI